jgi:hypothetical protein
MTTYTYRIEDPDDYEDTPLTPTLLISCPFYVLMKNGRDITWRLSRVAALEWCRRNTQENAA